MRNLEKKLRAAIVQAAPVFFDKQATLQKVVHQIEEAGRNGAQLIVFPESLVPCYPYGLTFGFTVGRKLPNIKYKTPMSSPQRKPISN
jgi:nitrilase